MIPTIVFSIYHNCFFFFINLKVFHASINRWFFAGQHVSSSLSILAHLRNIVVWMVYTRPLISQTSRLCTNPLVNEPRAPITIGITLTFMFHSFSVLWQGSGTYPSFLFLSVLHCGQVGQQSSQFGKFSLSLSFFFFFFCWLSFGLVVSPRLSDPSVAQNSREFSASNSPRQFLGRTHTVCTVKFQFLV